MKRLKEKLNKNGGFTLVEMLIVVAIIAILVAVSIPIVNNALDRARHATDQANERSAKAEIMIRYLSEESLDITKTYYYDAVDGSLKPAGSTITPYGKCKNGGHDENCGIIAVKINADGIVSMGWVADANKDVPADNNLCTGKDVNH